MNEHDLKCLQSIFDNWFSLSLLVSSPVGYLMFSITVSIKRSLYCEDSVTICYSCETKQKKNPPKSKHPKKIYIEQD